MGRVIQSLVLSLAMYPVAGRVMNDQVESSSTPRQLLQFNSHQPMEPMPPWPSPPPAIPIPPAPPFYATPPMAPKGNKLFGNWEENMPPAQPAPPGEEHEDFGWFSTSVGGETPATLSARVDGKDTFRKNIPPVWYTVPVVGALVVVLTIRFGPKVAKRGVPDEQGYEVVATGAKEQYGTFEAETAEGGDSEEVVETRSML